MTDQMDRRLQELVNQLAAAAPEAPPFPEEPTAAPRPSPFPSWALAAAGAAAVLIIIGLPFVLWGGGEQPDNAATSMPTSSSTPTVPEQTSSTTVPTTTVPTPTTTPPGAGPYRTSAFMLHDSGSSPTRAGPFLAPVLRNTGTLEDTVRELMYGLTPSEIDLGLSTAIPEGADLIGIDLADGIASVNVNAAFEDGAGTFSIGARLAQLVYTVTTFDPDISGVRLAVEGAPIEVFSSEGLVLDDPMTRQSFEGFAPGILIESPGFDGHAPPPLTITGVAATFEGSFQLEILDGDGTIVADVPFVQTDNGAGWGRFEVIFEASQLPAMPTELQIRVYELSALDGSVINERIQPFGYRVEP